MGEFPDLLRQTLPQINISEKEKGKTEGRGKADWPAQTSANLYYPGEYSSAKLDNPAHTDTQIS